MRKWIAVVILGLAIGCPRVWAQQKPPSLEAHRLYFVAVSSWADKDVDTAALAIKSYLNTAGVSESEHSVTFQALAKFKKNYAVLTSNYNNLPETLAGTNGATELFVTMRDRLVQDTIDLLQNSISAKSFESLEKQIAHDGLNIRSSPPESAAQHRHGARLVPVVGNMTGHYSASRSSSLYVYADGSYHYYETPVVDGYTTCSSSCATVTHQGTVTNTLGGGGTIYGPRVTPTSNISVSNQELTSFGSDCFDPSLPQPQPGCGTQLWDEDAQIQCSIFGKFFEWGVFDFAIHPAIVFSKANSGGPGQGIYQVSDWCLPEDSPPDLLMRVIKQNQNFTPTFFESGGFVVNSNLVPGVWLSTPGLSQGLTGSWDLQYCTKTTPPY